MQTSYCITQQGLMYAIASNKINENRLLLIHILKKYADTPISFAEICVHCDADKKKAFKQICGMLELGFIDIDEREHIQESPTHRAQHKQLSDVSPDNEFILSDLNGLPVTCSGFNQQQSLQLAAIACDFTRVSRRNRQVDQSNTLIPVSIETTWQDKNIIIYLLHLGYFSCLLTTGDTAYIKHHTFIHFASFLCGRYSHG